MNDDLLHDRRNVQEDDKLRERVAELEAIPTIYFNVSNTAKGAPTGTWPEGTPMPPPTVHALGDPEAVAGVQAFIAHAKDVEVDLGAALDLLRRHREMRVLGAGRSPRSQLNADTDAFLDRVDSGEPK